ncbi:hypothetical protein J2X63_003194 [Agromyces sp. 3263]|uniref:hypothetical protein n=1 Tax=Agromyces sp. 3263 TaxID=2817750 RepID=UPI00285A4B5A|nr:hypothetical protein [Agromyces sp. 3263]MDR6907486.1 hypothetical protein [Agromyces sp. 3263]
MSSQREVITLNQLAQRIRDWRLSVANWVHWQIEDHRGDVLAEVEFEYDGGACTNVLAIRRLTKD